MESEGEKKSSSTECDGERVKNVTRSQEGKSVRDDAIGAGADLIEEEVEGKDEEDENTDAMITGPAKRKLLEEHLDKNKNKTKKIQISVRSQVRRRGRLGRVCRESDAYLSPT